MNTSFDYTKHPIVLILFTLFTSCGPTVDEVCSGSKFSIECLETLSNLSDTKKGEGIVGMGYKQVETEQFLYKCERYRYESRASQSTFTLSLCQNLTTIEWLVDSKLIGTNDDPIDQILANGFIRIDDTINKEEIQFNFVKNRLLLNVEPLDKGPEGIWYNFIMLLES